MDDETIQNLEKMLGDFRKENSELVEKIEGKLRKGETLSPADMMNMVGDLKSPKRPNNPNSKSGKAEKQKAPSTFEEKMRMSLAPFASMGKNKIKQNSEQMVERVFIGRFLSSIFGKEKISDFFASFITHKRAPYKLARLLDNADTLKWFAIINIAIFFLYIIWRFIKRRRLGHPIPFGYRFRLYLFVSAIRFAVFYVMIYPYLDETWWIAQKTLF